MNSIESASPLSITTSFCKIEMKQKNILYIYTFENASIEIPQIDELNLAVKSMVGEMPYCIIVLPGHGSTSSHEGRQYAASLRRKNIIAEAIIIESLAIRLLASFYMKVNRPGHRIKLFEYEKDALTWINSIFLDSTIVS